MHVPGVRLGPVGVVADHLGQLGAGQDDHPQPQAEVLLDRPLQAYRQGGGVRGGSSRAVNSTLPLWM